MADVKKCDRCGAIYDLASSHKISIYETRGVYTFNDSDKDYDLCDHCMVEFNMFMKEKKEENI